MVKAEEITQEYVDRRLKEIEDEARIRADAENQALWHQAKRIARIKYYFWRHGRDTPDPPVTCGEIEVPELPAEPEPVIEPVYRPAEPVRMPEVHMPSIGSGVVGMVMVLTIIGITIYITQNIMNTITSTIPTTTNSAFMDTTALSQSFANVTQLLLVVPIALIGWFVLRLVAGGE